LEWIVPELSNSQRDVILIDGRLTGTDLLSAIETALKRADKSTPVQNTARAVLRGVSSLSTGSVEAADTMLLQFHADLTRLVETWIDICTTNGTFPCLIIDEANMALNMDHPNATKIILELFTAFTKQKLKMNVLLVSSEHSYPFHLSVVPFNLANISKHVFAGDVPPRDMFTLLTTHWGMGPHVRLCC
jgi:hypothetical protein